MRTNVTFRHFKSNPELHDAAMEAAEKFEKFHPGIISTDTIFTNDTDKIVEFNVKIQGQNIVAKENSDDFVKSLNEASDKIIRQLKKVKSKITNHI
ncbi:MAG: ribosome-associated translation inhibitor RaiA [FCB group bacterium]|jgi:ribosomal subunit interface protein